jgi:formylglycine-generating enzyme required for sulfatase activity
MRNPLLHTPSPIRVFRGGGWYYSARNTRVSSRIRSDASFRSINLGFRLSKTLEKL